MKRFAAHHVFLSPDKIFKLHCVELDDDNRLQNIFPLTKEIASTSFYNGTLLLIRQADYSENLIRNLNEAMQKRTKTSIIDLLKNQYFTEIQKGEVAMVIVSDENNRLVVK